MTDQEAIAAPALAALSDLNEHYAEYRRLVFSELLAAFAADVAPFEGDVNQDELMDFARVVADRAYRFGNLERAAEGADAALTDLCAALDDLEWQSEAAKESGNYLVLIPFLRDQQKELHTLRCAIESELSCGPATTRVDTLKFAGECQRTLRALLDRFPRGGNRPLSEIPALFEEILGETNHLHVLEKYGLKDGCSFCGNTKHGIRVTTDYSAPYLRNVCQECELRFSPEQLRLAAFPALLLLGGVVEAQ